MRLRALRETPAYMRLFLMGWTVYFINYFGRYNYAAAMVVIGQAEGLRTDQLGLIASTLFVSYGLGQLFSGWLGDRLNPKALIAAGMLGSAGSNLLMGLAGSVGLMQAAWCLNGLFCALIWAPMIRLMTLCMPPERLRKAILSFHYATSLGTTGTYLLIPLLVTHFPWRVSFLVPAALTLLTGLGWIAVGATTRGCYQTPEKVETKNTVKATESFRALYLVSGLPLLLAIILFMGLLKDGIMTWVPQEMTDTFQIDAALSIFLTAILPLVNLAGLWLIQKLSKRPGSDDVRTSFLLFGAAGAGMLLLVAVGRLHPLLTVLLFSAVSLCVFGINTVLISLVPLQFAKAGRSSTVAGLTNAFTYLGSALSGWGLGLAAGQWGWNAVNWLLFGLCAAGMGLCLAVRPLWRRFLGL